MAEIIFNAEFVKTEYAGNSCKNIKKQINTDEMVDYYERKEACDYTVDENEDDDTYQINSQDAFNYYDYRIGSTGGFNRNGNLEKGEANRLMEKYQPKILWRFVFSFEKEFAQNSNIITKTNMQKLMTKSMEKNIRALGFDPQNVEWAHIIIPIQIIRTVMCGCLKKNQQNVIIKSQKRNLIKYGQMLLEQWHLIAKFISNEII